MSELFLQPNLIPKDLDITTHTVQNAHNSKHKHHHYEIFYVLNGTIEHVINGQTQKLGIGDCIFLTKDDTHQFVKTKHSFHRDILISNELFDAIFSLITSRESSIKLTLSPTNVLNFTIPELLELELLATKFTNSTDVTVKRGIGIELLVKLLNKYIGFSQTSFDNTPPLITRILILLNKSYGIKGGTSVVFKDMNYSQSYICSYFKKYMGVTLSQYIRDVRLKHVEYYLITTDYSLPQIADLVGIDSLSYLNRIFKAKHGIPPMKFRKNHKSFINENNTSHNI